MKRKLLFAAIFIASALGSNLFAQFDADKTYVISNRNDANVFMQDNGTGIVAAGSSNGNSYWIFEAAENADCYYVKNAVTGKYMQSTKTSGESVATGTTPVEICVKLCSVEGNGMYGFASTDQSKYDFTSGTIGANWDNSRVQGYEAVAGTNHKSFWKVVEQAMPDPEPTVPTDWSAPQAPGVDLSTLSESTDVFVYNIEADAIFSRGFNWLTMALADRPEGGDNAVPANRQKVQIRRDGNNIKIHWNDRGADVFFGQANNTDPGQMWTDLGNAGNRVVFTPAASENYPNAYTLTNVQHNQKVDVLWARGGKLTLWNGQGFYDWAFLTGDAFTSGKLAQFKVRKAMWGLYQALAKANALETNAEALATALTTYAKVDATTDELRTAFRTMFLATAASIEDPVDVSYMFTHPDMSGDKTATGWSYTDFAFSAGECEKYHAAFESTQIVNDAPNGLYEVVFTGIYRQDDGQTQAAPQLVVSSGTSELTANFPNMEQLGGRWNIGGNETDDWKNSSTGKKPMWMWSASDAQTLDDAAAIIESAKVKDHTLGVTFKVTGGNQWFNFQRVFITYKGSINSGLYKTLLAKIEEGNNYSNPNVSQKYIDAIATAINAAGGLSANSEEQELSDAVQAITDAISAANAAPLNSNLELLASTITLAAADGVDVTSAQNSYDNATTNDDIVTALTALRLARRVKNAETQADVFAGNAPAAGDYYLYNVGTGRFFCGGDDWGAHAAIGFPGIIVTLEGDGTYKLNTHLQNGDDNGNPKYYLNYGGYCDTWTSDSWTFTEVSTGTGVYNIVRSSDNNLMLGYSTNTYNRLDTDKSGADNPNNQWKLVTKADRDALLATATKEAPQDASYLIKSPNFSQREDVSAWTFTNASIWGRGGNHPDFAIEAYDKPSATVEQTVTGLPAGTYELKVQAFYRDGNFETQVNTLSNGGDARQLATLYAGTKSSLIQNVSGGADKAPGMGRASTIGYMPDGIDDACLYFQSGLYWATLDEIVVGQDGTMTIGARKTQKLNDGDWMVLDNFRLIYKGAGIDLTGVKADLLAKIGEATTLLNNLDLNLSFLATAVTTGQNAYDNSTDADEIVNATTALQTAINQVNAATDMTVFKQTLAKATAEGMTITAYTDAVEGVTDGSTLASVVRTELNNVRIARKMNALAMPDIYTGAAPEAGKVYLFNVGTRLFLGAGSDWNTHAAVDQVGIEVELVAAEGGFTMKSAWGSFNDSPYVDTGANTVYTFQAVAGKENVYNILQGTDLLGWNPNGKTDGQKYWNNISNVTGADAADANYQWKVITAAERKALLAQASYTNPVDVSYLINNPSHNRKAGYDMYTKVASGGNGGVRVSSQDDNNGDRAADYGYEFWNVDNLEWSQQLTGLTPGKYEVAVQGYYREGDGGYQAGVVNNGGTLLRNAYLKAGEKTAELQNIAYCLDGVPGVGTAVSNNGAFPNWPREAFEYFETGYYWTSVQVTVGNDGLLKIGVYKDSKTDNDWIVLDNFRLRLLEAATGSANATITDAEYATFIAPFDVEIPDGVTASTATINEMDDTKLDLTPLDDVIPAHTPVILYSEETLNQNFEGILVAEPDNLKTGVLTGTYEEIDAYTGSYVLQNQAGNVGFFLVEGSDKPKVSANRAYLTVENSNLVKAFILGESDADGIRSLDNEFLGKNNGAIFNLAGQRMTKTQRGVNIVNKKKVVIK